MDGKSAEAKLRYDAARQRARMMRLPYMSAEKLAEAPLEEILSRIALLDKKGLIEDEPSVTAVLGGEAPPPLTLSNLFETFEALSETAIKGLSPDQKRKWDNPKKKAIENFKGVIGDKELAKLTRDDAVQFVEWWEDQLRHENLAVDTANKDIGHLGKMLRIVERRNKLGIMAIFTELRIEGRESKQRIAYLPTFIQSDLLADGALDELNVEARRILYLMAETGLRLSEAANLTASTIHLEAEIPYISVRPEGRKLKTPQSERDIPLVGVALEAMKLQPDGFPRYRDKGASLSALVNQYLKNHGLTPEGQTAYSLRHSFEDRLTAVEAPEKVVAALMGHKWIRPKYGLGPTLEQKQSWLQRIAFKPPSRV